MVVKKTNSKLNETNGSRPTLIQEAPANKNLWIKNLLAEICHFNTQKIQEPA